MGPIGIPELLIVLALVLILFGAGKLPEVMASMGRGVREFRNAAEGPPRDAPAAPAAPSEHKPE